MVPSASPAMVALMICIAGTFAILAFTIMWARNTSRPVRRRANRLTGRAADPYYHSPTRLQDERGIKNPT